MKQYELLCLFRYENEPDGTLPPKLETVVNAIQKYQGNIMSQEDFGIRRLAYPIEQQTTGHYVIFNVNFDGDAIKPLNALLTIESSLLRHQLVTYVKTQKPREDETPAQPEAAQSSTPSSSHSDTPAAPKIPLTSEELDKTIDRILEEKVL